MPSHRVFEFFDIENLDISSTMLVALPDEAFNFLCESFRSEPENGKIRFPALENLSINTLLLKTEDPKAQTLHHALYEHADYHFSPQAAHFFLHFLKTLDHRRKNITTLNVLDFGKNKLSRITTPRLLHPIFLNGV